MLLTLLRAAGGPQVYAVIYPAALSAPTASQVLAGQNVNGVSATWAGSNPAPTTSQTLDWLVLASGLSSGTNYRVAFVWYDGTWYSNVAVSASFTTTAGGSQYFRLNLGGLTVAGTIRRQTRTQEAGSLVPFGSIRRFTRSRVFGAVVLLGQARRAVRRRLLGTITLAGAARRFIRTIRSGSINGTGTARRLTRKRFLGSLTLSSILSRIKQGGGQTFQRAVGGTITALGVIRKRSTRRLSSTVTGLTGTIRKFTRAPKMAGTVVATSALSDLYVVRRAVSGSVTAVGQIRKFTRRGLLGSSTGTGGLRKRARRLFASSVPLVGGVAKRTRRRLLATIVVSGTSLRRFSFRVVTAAVITVAGSLVRTFVPPAPPDVFSQRLTHLRRYIGRR